MMDKEQQSLIKYAAISLLAMAIGLVLIALITNVNNVTPQSSVSVRTYNLTDDTFRQTYLYIENSTPLYDKMLEDYVALLDQILLERYNKTEKVERHAVIEGGVEQKGNTISFRLRFIPSNQVFDCIVTTRSETEGVRVSMEEVR